MSYLQVKNHALLNYTKMELFFTLLKVKALRTQAIPQYKCPLDFDGG